MKELRTEQGIWVNGDMYGTGVFTLGWSIFLATHMASPLTAFNKLKNFNRGERWESAQKAEAIIVSEKPRANNLLALVEF